MRLNHEYWCEPECTWQTNSIYKTATGDRLDSWASRHWRGIELVFKSLDCFTVRPIFSTVLITRMKSFSLRFFFFFFAFTIWCCIPISRAPRVFRRFKRRSCLLVKFDKCCVQCLSHTCIGWSWESNLRLTLWHVLKKLSSWCQWNSINTASNTCHIGARGLTSRGHAWVACTNRISYWVGVSENSINTTSNTCHILVLCEVEDQKFGTHQGAYWKTIQLV